MSLNRKLRWKSHSPTGIDEKIMEKKRREKKKKKKKERKKEKKKKKKRVPHALL